LPTLRHEWLPSVAKLYPFTPRVFFRSDPPFRDISDPSNRWLYVCSSWPTCPPLPLGVLFCGFSLFLFSLRFLVSVVEKPPEGRQYPEPGQLPHPRSFATIRKGLRRLRTLTAVAAPPSRPLCQLFSPLPHTVNEPALASLFS